MIVALKLARWGKYVDCSFVLLVTPNHMHRRVRKNHNLQTVEQTWPNPYRARGPGWASRLLPLRSRYHRTTQRLRHISAPFWPDMSMTHARRLIFSSLRTPAIHVLSKRVYKPESPSWTSYSSLWTIYLCPPNCLTSLEARAATKRKDEIIN